MKLLRLSSISLIKFVLIYFALSPELTYSQNVKESHHIILNSITRKPIEGASVIWAGSGKGTASDSLGSITLQIKEETKITISCIGYQTLVVTISPGNLNSIFEMVPMPLEQTGITIVGFRGAPRSVVNKPVPIDVISRAELEGTGQIDLAQMAQFTSPSFVSVKTGLNGASNYADPASLKGMSPDQSLVLVNNKRRHQFSAISNNPVPGKGTVVTDLNAIPALALERIEILRDGAAAQYGSDAIAGIMNLFLRNNATGGVIRTEAGVTHKGDGITSSTSVNKGFSLGKHSGFLNVTISYQYVSGTDRSDPYTGNIYVNNKVTDDSIRDARQVWPSDKPAYVLKYGSNQTKSFQSFFNFAYPFGKNWKWVGFGGSSNKDILAYGFFRTVKSSDPNSSPLYPDGYTPLLPGSTADYSFYTGLEHVSTKGWTMDMGSSYGYNHLDLFCKNSCNPSLGLESPKDFYVGRNAFTQSTTEANFNKAIKNLRHFKALNISFGTQLRYDLYKLREGDSFSYAVGPLAKTLNKAPGSSGRPGISLADRITKSRMNSGTYIDIEADINKKWLLAFASRYENYSDFGSNITGKIATRWSFSDRMSLRGSVNRGFRAPSLQQIYNGQTTSNAQNGIIRQTKQLPANDSRLSELGINFPVPEFSWNYNLGWTLQAGSYFLFTVDAYSINVHNRIIISEVLPISKDIPTLYNVFPSSMGIQEITFFTNHINTRTTGIDFVGSMKKYFLNNRKVRVDLAFTLNKTIITGRKPTPLLLTDGAIRQIKLIDTISESLITVAQPHQKGIITLEYSSKKIQLLFRSTYFGKVTAWEKPPGSWHRSQTFSAKCISDISAGYTASPKLKFNIGINNLFNIYPDRINKTYSSYTNGQIPYSRNALQFGFNGTFFFSGIQYLL